MALELHLIEGDGLLQYRVVSRPSQILFEVSDGFAEGQVLRKFDKPNQITAALAAVAIEQILAGISIERRPGFRVQRAETHKLLSRSNATGPPVAPLQVLQQRNTPFELFQILAHGGWCRFQFERKRWRAAFPGKDGG